MTWLAQRLLAELENAVEDELGFRRVLIGGFVIGGPTPAGEKVQIALSLSTWATITVQRASATPRLGEAFFYRVDTPEGQGAGAPASTLAQVADSVAHMLDEWSLR